MFAFPMLFALRTTICCTFWPGFTATGNFVEDLPRAAEHAGAFNVDVFVVGPKLAALPLADGEPESLQERQTLRPRIEAKFGSEEEVASGTPFQLRCAGWTIDMPMMTAVFQAAASIEHIQTIK
jgi:hypothetical protein